MTPELITVFQTGNPIALALAKAALEPLKRARSVDFPYPCRTMEARMKRLALTTLLTRSEEQHV